MEGEKCAAAIHSFGLAAVTSPGGCKAAHTADWRPLQRFKRIVLLPDNDEPGEAYARAVAGILAALPGSREVSIARLPGLPPAGDVVDFLASRVAGEWDEFGPVPREAGDGLLEELLEAIDAHAEPVTLEGVTSTGEPWEEPVPLEAVVLPPWPSGVFPGPVQGFLDALAEATETPGELGAACVLAVLATAAQGKYRVHVRAAHFEPLCLWTCYALPSGSRKSTVLEQCRRPLALWEGRKAEELQPEIKRRASERRTLEKRIECLRGQAAKSKDAREYDTLAAEIAELEAGLPEPLHAPRLWTQDATPEMLAVLMAQHGGRIAALSDEAGIFSIMAGRYSKGEPNLDIYLHGHSGDAVRVERIGRESVVLDSALLSVGITPQPDVIAKLSTTPEFRGRGLLARFMYFMPVSNIGSRTGDGPPIPEHVRLGWHSAITAILEEPFALNESGNPCAHTLELSSEALAAWRHFAVRVEADCAAGGRFEHIRDWASKFAGAVARIAAVLHVAHHAGRGIPQHIEAEDMSAALRMAEPLAAHALMVFDAIGADAALEDARAILEWVGRERLESFTRTEAYVALRRRFRNAAALNAAFNVLEERGHVRVTRTFAPGGQGGRPTERYELNPRTAA